MEENSKEVKVLKLLLPVERCNADIMNDYIWENPKYYLQATPDVQKTYSVVDTVARSSINNIEIFNGNLTNFFNVVRELSGYTISYEINQDITRYSIDPPKMKKKSFGSWFDKFDKVA